MDLYLQGDVVDQSVIDDAGGVLCYWQQELKTRPQLAQMALDFLSAPGEAVYTRGMHSRHWGRGHLEMGQNISGTLKGEAQFTWHISVRHISCPF